MQVWHHMEVQQVCTCMLLLRLYSIAVIQWHCTWWHMCRHNNCLRCVDKEHCSANCNSSSACKKSPKKDHSSKFTDPMMHLERPTCLASRDSVFCSWSLEPCIYLGVEAGKMYNNKIFNNNALSVYPSCMVAMREGHPINYLYVI